MEGYAADVVNVVQQEWHKLVAVWQDNQSGPSYVKPLLKSSFAFFHIVGARTVPYYVKPI